MITHAINGFGCGGEQKVKAEDLQEIDTQIKGIKIPKFVNSFANRRSLRRAKFRDMARKVAFGVNFAIIGIESQETIDYAIPLRNMLYDVAEYEKQASKIRKKIRKEMQGLSTGEYLYGFAKDSKLSPVATFILYSGEEEWTGPTCLHDMLDFTDIPKNLQKLIPNYEINVISIRNIKDTSMFRTDLKYVLDFLRFSTDKNKLKELVQNTPYYQSMDEDAYDVVANYANVSGLIAAKEYCIEDGGKMNMCTAIKEMMEDSRMEGKLGGFVEALQLVGQTKEAIISKVSEEFGLDLQEAAENVEKYLK